MLISHTDQELDNLRASFAGKEFLDAVRGMDNNLLVTESNFKLLYQLPNNIIQNIVAVWNRLDKNNLQTQDNFTKLCIMIPQVGNDSVVIMPSFDLPRDNKKAQAYLDSLLSATAIDKHKAPRVLDLAGAMMQQMLLLVIRMLYPSCPAG